MILTSKVKKTKNEKSHCVKRRRYRKNYPRISQHRFETTHLSVCRQCKMFTCKQWQKYHFLARPGKTNFYSFFTNPCPKNHHENFANTHKKRVLNTILNTIQKPHKSEQNSLILTAFSEHLMKQYYCQQKTRRNIQIVLNFANSKRSSNVGVIFVKISWSKNVKKPTSPPPPPPQPPTTTITRTTMTLAKGGSGKRRRS